MFSHTDQTLLQPIPYCLNKNSCGTKDFSYSPTPPVRYSLEHKDSASKMQAAVEVQLKLDLSF